MLFWLPRRRARMDVAAEAETLMRDLGEAAYGEARRREDEASSDEIARDWGLVALAVARVIRGRKDVDPLVRLAMNAVLVPDRKEAASRDPRSLSKHGRADEARPTALPRRRSPSESGPILRVAVVVGSGEVVNARFCVHPDDGVRGTATARLLLGRELSGAGRGRSSGGRRKDETLYRRIIGHCGVAAKRRLSRSLHS